MTTPTDPEPDMFDLVVVGGGINGAGIARDAAGRGLRVALAEQGDVASATSSASTKLIHGGLRYLEHYEFRLVRESLVEREIVLAVAPHLAETLRFVLPHEPHLRPRWLLRLGLLFYDHLNLRMTLPTSAAVDLARSPLGSGLKPDFAHGFAFSDGRVDDARLVVANLRSARDLGATILPRTAVVAARREGPDRQQHWSVDLDDGRTLRSKAVVNAAGPWVKRWLDTATEVRTKKRVRLVKGSHIVVPRLYDGDQAYILQSADRRVGFVIPFERDYSLIGTTDVIVDGDPGPADITTDEIRYLCTLVNHYLAREVRPEDVVWTFAGVRPLFDDGRGDPSAVTRDYVLELDDVRRPGAPRAAPIVSVFGGKLTTYRRLAEHVLKDLGRYFPTMGPRWTATTSLPGGDLPAAPSSGERFERFMATLAAARPGLTRDLLVVLAHRHGTDLNSLLDGVTSVADLGRHFGGFLYEREVEHFVREEWARDADDILWRRTKEGIRLTAPEQAALAEWLAAVGTPSGDTPSSRDDPGQPAHPALAG